MTVFANPKHTTLVVENISTPVESTEQRRLTTIVRAKHMRVIALSNVELQPHHDARCVLRRIFSCALCTRDRRPTASRTSP